MKNHHNHLAMCITTILQLTACTQTGDKSSNNTENTENTALATATDTEDVEAETATDTTTETSTETTTDTETETEAEEESCEPGECWQFEAETDFMHEQGVAEGEGWACSVSEHTPNRMLYGPYTEEIPSGWYEAHFFLMSNDDLSQGSSDDSVVLMDVYDANGGLLLAQQELYRGDLMGDGAYQKVSLLFEADEAAKLEFRAYWQGVAHINIDKVEVRVAEVEPCFDNNPCTLDVEEADGSCSNQESALEACANPPCAVENSCLYVVDIAAMSPEEATMMASLQGVLAQNRPAIWLADGSDDALTDLTLNYGVSIYPVDDPWELVERFQPAVAGYLLADLYGAQDSLSVASSLSGVLGAVIADTSVEQGVIDKGLSMVADVRDKDEPWVLENYAGEFSSTMLIEQREAPDISPWFLRDLAASHKIFTYHQGDDPEFRQQAITEVAGNSLPYVLGWASDVGGGEYNFVHTATMAGAAVIPADYSTNLSVLSQVSTADTMMPQPAANSFDASKHYVAFVLSDGDNITWMQGGFVDDSRWWNSPIRGSFPMTWGLATTMVDYAPSLLADLAAQATTMDAFVGGPSGAGYTLPSYHPLVEDHAALTSDLAQSTNMKLFTMIDSTYDGGSIQSAIPYLDQPHVDGVMYDSYGANPQTILMHNGKLALEYTHYLWNGSNDNMYDPSSLAAAINAAPRSPADDIDSYSLVFVHCWSRFDSNGDGVEDMGTMEAVQAVVSALDTDVEVITAPQLFNTITTHFQGDVCGDSVCDASEDCLSCAVDCVQCTSLTYEAETDLQHADGLADGDGWVVVPNQHSAGHMLYGPYLEGLPAGDYTVSYELMIQDLAAAAGVNMGNIDVYDAANQVVLAQSNLNGSDFASAGAYQPFDLGFTAAANSRLEFRLWWNGSLWLKADKVVVNEQ